MAQVDNYHQLFILFFFHDRGKKERFKGLFGLLGGGEFGLFWFVFVSLRVGW
jgi:hypothetical protein